MDMHTTIGFCLGTTKCRRCRKEIGYNEIKPLTKPTYCDDCIDKDWIHDIRMCPICDGEEFNVESAISKKFDLLSCVKCGGLRPITKK